MALINGTEGNDILVGTNQNDQIFALGGNDLAFGLEGNDLISGGNGIDILNGNQGNDILLGGSGDDLLYGGQNDDILYGEAGNDQLIGNLGNDQLNGNAGDDAVYGGQGDDIVRGGQGSDRIFGDIGNDVLYGDLGNNTLTGGPGQDIFVIGGGNQTLADFVDGIDRITLTTGLTFTNLIISQGTGTSTIIRNQAGQILATVQGINANQLTADDFTNSNTPLPTPTPAPSSSLPIGGGSPSPSPTPAAVAFTLQVLHTADQEAGLPAITDAVNFSAIFNAFANTYPNTVKLTSGDVYIAGPFLRASTEIYGANREAVGDILINNALGFQAAALGNHEFDLGPGLVGNLIKANNTVTGPGIGAGGYPGTQFPYLSTNLDFSKENALKDLVVPAGGAPKPNTLSKSVVLNVGGDRVGVVGATTPTLPSIATVGNVTVTPANNNIDALAAEIQTTVDQLVAQGINKIILLAHMQQIQVEEQLATRLKNVDIIMAGGSNTILANSDDPLRPGNVSAGPYPKQFNSATNEPVYLINTDGNYRYVGRLIAGFDPNGIITQIGNDSGAYATDAAGVNRVYGRTVNPRDVANPTVVQVTDAISSVVTAKDKNIFGNTSVYLEGRRTPVRTEETNLGNLTADANLIIGRKTDSTVIGSIKNGGGIRDSIGQAIIPPGGLTNTLQFSPPPANPGANKKEGDISQLDIENALRFNNSLTLVTVKASELKTIAEHGVAATNTTGATPGQFPQISGMAFSFDVTKAAGSRVQNLAIKDDQGNTVDAIVENGNLVGDPNRTLRLITLGFLATGGDSYPFPTFPQLNATNLPVATTGTATFTTDNTEQDAFAEYIAANYQANPFNGAEKPVTQDTRIQDVAKVAADTVLTGKTVGFAGDGANTITGDGNPNILVGYAGVDQISGQGGNDIIAGGLGADNLTGGADNDVFVYATPADGGDTITDFGNGADTIRVFASTFTGLTKGVTPTLTLAAAPVGTSAQFLYNGGVLSFDSDGTGATAAQGLATLTGAPGLAANQIVVV